MAGRKASRLLEWPQSASSWAGWSLWARAGPMQGCRFEPVLEGSAPQWADGYNHFVLTMSAPCPAGCRWEPDHGPRHRQARTRANYEQRAGPMRRCVQPLRPRCGLGAAAMRQVLSPKAPTALKVRPGPQGAASSQGARSTAGTLSAGRHPLAGCDAELRKPHSLAPWPAHIGLGTEPGPLPQGHDARTGQ